VVDKFAQARIDGLRDSSNARILVEHLQSEVDKVKTALVTAPMDKVPGLQGEARALLRQIDYFSKKP
jgi:hypothetical protein